MTFVYFLVYRHHTGILLDVQKTKRRLVAEIIASMHKVQTHEIEIYKQPITQSLISYRIRIAFSIKKNDSLFLYKKIIIIMFLGFEIEALCWWFWFLYWQKVQFSFCRPHKTQHHTSWQFDKKPFFKLIVWSKQEVSCLLLFRVHFRDLFPFRGLKILVHWFTLFQSWLGFSNFLFKDGNLFWKKSNLLYLIIQIPFRGLTP